MKTGGQNEQGRVTGIVFGGVGGWHRLGRDGRIAARVRHWGGGGGDVPGRFLAGIGEVDLVAHSLTGEGQEQEVRK